ncbi:unnamed protein product [Ixodes pacificus]
MWQDETVYRGGNARWLIASFLEMCHMFILSSFEESCTYVGSLTAVVLKWGSAMPCQSSPAIKVAFFFSD